MLLPYMVGQWLTFIPMVVIYKYGKREVVMKQAKEVSYGIDDYGTMTIYADGCSVADISDCGKLDRNQIEALIGEVLEDLGYEV
jgi:hypothetical protein